MDNKTEDAQAAEDTASLSPAKLEALAEEVKDKDPAMADDLKKLAKSKLSMKSFDDYMKLKAAASKPDACLQRHKAKVLAKRRAAAKAAKKARKASRRRK